VRFPGYFDGLDAPESWFLNHMLVPQIRNNQRIKKKFKKNRKQNKKTHTNIKQTKKIKNKNIS
jgi:hypothetical protein